MRYSLNPEFDARLKEAFDQLDLEEEVREVILELMDIAARDALVREIRRIARCLVDEGLSPEKIKRITGCDIEELEQFTTLH